MTEDQKILEEFLSLGMSRPDEVFEKFMTLPNAQRHEYLGYTYCIYVPGKRPDRVLLTAHADTVFCLKGRHRMKCEVGKYTSLEPDDGIGADDRAGCAILWQLRDSGHSLLITNDEEIGCKGALMIFDRNQKLFDELNSHSYILEFDRRHAKDYKVYDLPVTEEFKRFIEENTGFTEADKRSSTDIRHLCEKVCGANLSVGYYYEHTPKEYLVYDEWLNTLNTARTFLAKSQPDFPML
ncbi:MAG: hypothetical protein IJS39_12670 [Synergistaceae bacterium]|nr:hypothetical protein [Synergistaceae bacterium]